MQPHTPDADVDPDEAFQLVFRELKRHEETGRRNFVVRVPVDLLEYLFSAILRKSGMSRVALERLLTELGIYGFKDADGRILRRYLSGHTRMAWSTYQRLMLWALTNEWISMWAFRDLAFRSYEREAAQLCARKIVNTLKRRATISDLTKEQVIVCFYEIFLLKQRERGQAAATRLRTDADTRELVSSIGFGFGQ
ncbi:hypothetical protein A264_06194 [Pseudomonas syringae pv. actinidiae ICMP 19071]|uniref:hypothetical protein n=1 Tax=Pseudomonas syringae TaxID=317 RepID=UPI00035836C7|nr:hypothetical protein [Pseudomonas syringae]EPM61761.1 hypothetical protein A264_06194 [Pseudomonas syringae pv. actinidiae ICMP 19071]EPM80247.1 hypothetical protein A3SO_03215 [Pseudomonas syringae pv. actinidiae ICMP 19072]OSN61781.1 hypothetical protein BV349_04897 [Pseudomonas syringae pv. actinidiae]OSN69573.1 hypothetical protein BV351_05282 [Pseudomonas syringae pv. actinidiae]RMS13827.1 hypothetical protein ALP75_200056 [Pseudomonas syringae pv. actinidiae]